MMEYFQEAIQIEHKTQLDDDFLVAIESVALQAGMSLDWANLEHQEIVQNVITQTLNGGNAQGFVFEIVNGDDINSDKKAVSMMRKVSAFGHDLRLKFHLKQNDNYASKFMSDTNIISHKSDTNIISHKSDTNILSHKSDKSSSEPQNSLSTSEITENMHSPSASLDSLTLSYSQTSLETFFTDSDTTSDTDYKMDQLTEFNIWKQRARSCIRLINDNSQHRYKEYRSLVSDAINKFGENGAETIWTYQFFASHFLTIGEWDLCHEIFDEVLEMVNISNLYADAKLDTSEKRGISRVFHDYLTAVVGLNVNELEEYLVAYGDWIHGRITLICEQQLLNANEINNEWMCDDDINIIAILCSHIRILQILDRNDDANILVHDLVIEGEKGKEVNNKSRLLANVSIGNKEIAELSAFFGI